MIVQFLVAGFAVSLPSQMGWGQAHLDFLMGACGALFVLSGGGQFAVDTLLAGRGSRKVEVGAPSI